MVPEQPERSEIWKLRKKEGAIHSSALGLTLPVAFEEFSAATPSRKPFGLTSSLLQAPAALSWAASLSFLLLWAPSDLLLSALLGVESSFHRTQG